MVNRSPFVLVDGSSYLYRAYHALPPLSNTRGEPTGAILGVANMLRRLLTDYTPDHLAVVFDAKGKTFRDDLYAKYKATRPPMPDDLAAQIEPLLNLVRALGLPLIQHPGVEADDVIATLAVQAEALGMHCVISTGDKDMAQLVNERISLVNTMSQSIFDVAGVQTKFGVPPQRIVDYLALIGDTSDNVPGVPKVGPKTAVRWLNDYGSLDAIIAHAAEISGKVGENLRANLDQLALARQLVTLRCDVPLPFGPVDLKRAPEDAGALHALLTRFEFGSWLAALEAASAAAAPQALPVNATPPANELRFEVITDHAALQQLVACLKAAPLIALDTETTGLDCLTARLVGLSFAVESRPAVYIPVGHHDPAVTQLALDEVLNQLRPILQDASKPKLGHNLKYDLNVLLNHGIALAGITHDSMLQSYIADSTATRHDMDSLAALYLNQRTIRYEEVAGKGAKQIGFEHVPVAKAAPYAAEDADVTLRLHQTLWPKLAAQPGLAAVYQGVEIPLIPVLARMERTGVLVDRAALEDLSREFTIELAALEQSAHACAGMAFNLNSPKQIQELLFERIKLPAARKTATGQISTAEDVLEELAQQHELPRLILDYRALAKLKSTYTDRLVEQIHPLTGRVHTSYHQAVAATGRLSSTDPNLQNIPIRTAQGRRIRRAFIPPAGHMLVAADYSQIELRIMAHLSDDEVLRRAFLNGLDVHRATAAEVFGTDAVSTEQRRAAKAINFGLIYGMSAFGLARQLGIDRGAAQRYVDLYFARYPAVRAYMERTRAEAHTRGYVETLFGRRLYLPEINAKNSARRQYAERTAINAPMQGTAADIIKRAMITVHAWLTERGAPARLLMQVHDELVLEVQTDAIAEVTTEVRRLMEQAAELSVPLVVEAGYGPDWDRAHTA